MTFHDDDLDPADAAQWGGSGKSKNSHETEADVEADNPLGIWDAGDDDYVIPPRGWLLGNTFCRGFLSSLLADGGIGKSSLRLAQLLSCATGLSLTGERVHVRSRVLILSLEDGKDELRRRVLALLLHHNIKPETIKGWLFLSTPPKAIRLANIKEGTPEIGKLTDIINKEITTRNIDIVCLDPFIKSHGMSENDNNSIDFVCGLLTDIGIEHDCAVDTPHHTRKGIGVPGDADRGRGASSMKDAARLVYTLNTMTTDEASLFNIPETDRKSLIRYDPGKVNIAPPASEAKWFRLVGVSLGNGTDQYLLGDSVQAVEVWLPPDLWDGIDVAIANRILTDIDTGMANGSRYSAAAAAKRRAAWPVVVKHAPEKSQQQARNMVQLWIKSGTLFEEQYDDPFDRKPAEGLRANPDR